MKLFFDFFPVLIFFIAYKWAGLYTATAVAIAISFGQMSFAFIRHRRVEPLTLITFVVLAVLGGSTLLFHNATFIKWKPTVVEWALALVFILSPFFTAKPLTERMLGNDMTLESRLWRRLDFSWAAFFAVMGGVNLFVAMNYSTDTWVNFKLFGMFGATLVFVVLQALYVSRRALTTSVDPLVFDQELDVS